MSAGGVGSGWDEKVSDVAVIAGDVAVEEAGT